MAHLQITVRTRTTPSINGLMAALVAELVDAEGGADFDPLAERLTLLAVWADLYRLCRRAPPRLHPSRPRRHGTRWCDGDGAPRPGYPPLRAAAGRTRRGRRTRAARPALQPRPALGRPLPPRGRDAADRRGRPARHPGGDRVRGAIRALLLSARTRAKGGDDHGAIAQPRRADRPPRGRPRTAPHRRRYPRRQLPPRHRPPGAGRPARRRPTGTPSSAGSGAPNSPRNTSRRAGSSSSPAASPTASTRTRPGSGGSPSRSWPANSSRSTVARTARPPTTASRAGGATTGPTATMCPSSMRSPFLRLRARRGRLLLLISPPGRLSRLVIVAGRHAPHVRCLLVHHGGLAPGDPGGRPTTTGARRPEAALRAA